MAVYLILLTFISFFSYIYIKTTMTKKQYIVIVFAMYALLGVMRDYSIGTDTEMFVGFFNGYSSGEHRFEKGFLLLVKFIKIFSSDARVFIAVTTILSIIGFAYFIYKLSLDVIMSTYLFFFMNCYFFVFNNIRQAIAVSIALMGYVCFNEKKYIRMIVLFVLAGLFHNSGYIVWLALGAHIFLGKVKSNKIRILVLVVMMIATYYIQPFIYQYATNGYYSYYSGSSFVEKNYGGSLLFLMLDAVILLYMFCVDKNMMENDSTENELRIYRFSIVNMICAVCISFASIQIEIFSRFHMNLFVVILYLLPQSICLLGDSKNRYRKLIKGGIYLCAILYWGVIACFRPEWFSAIPYKFG